MGTRPGSMPTVKRWLIMPIYFLNSEVPELTPLRRAKRRAVLGAARKMLWLEQPAVRINHAIMLWITLFSAQIFAMCLADILGGPSHLLVGVITVAAISSPAFLVINSAYLERLRPTLRACLKECANDRALAT